MTFRSKGMAYSNKQLLVHHHHRRHGPGAVLLYLPRVYPPAYTLWLRMQKRLCLGTQHVPREVGSGERLRRRGMVCLLHLQAAVHRADVRRSCFGALRACQRSAWCAPPEPLRRPPPSDVADDYERLDGLADDHERLDAANYRAHALSRAGKHGEAEALRTEVRS